jgi:aminoglycoside 6'-N-acetyltransferase I
MPDRPPVDSLPPAAEVRLLGPGDGAVLARVAPGVFDNPVHPRWSAEFLADPRHHLAVAVDEGMVVGMASAVHYVHPDKAPELWINEVGVAPTHHNRGIARRLLAALFDRGRELGCGQAWVLTDRGNPAAMRMYAAAGGQEHPTPSIMFEFNLTAESSQDDARTLRH